MRAVLNHDVATQPNAAHESPSRPADRRHVLAVVGLTAVAGAARFASAGVPALWNDEAQTFRRVCGTFAELSVMLRESAFPPLHYYLYWLLGRALGGAQHLTPFWMRFIPALAGTLMVPAMWRLAGLYCRRDVALLVAALTACSGFLFTYAHDAKMYMPLWLRTARKSTCPKRTVRSRSNLQSACEQVGTQPSLICSMPPEWCEKPAILIRGGTLIRGESSAAAAYSCLASSPLWRSIW
jgi:hypothetical protein